jgi:hypothetical protein
MIRYDSEGGEQEDDEGRDFEMTFFNVYIVVRRTIKKVCNERLALRVWFVRNISQDVFYRTARLYFFHFATRFV